MLILLASPDSLIRKGAPDKAVAAVFVETKVAGNPVAILSNHAMPDWFEGTFGTSGVQFLRVPGRQNGKIIVENAAKLNLQPYDALVLAAKPEDIQMGKNGGAVLIAAGWSADSQVQGLGIRVENAAELSEVIKLTDAWSGKWWFEGNGPKYRVRALADLSGYNKTITQQGFGQKVTQTVKNGGSRLKALLAITARSLLTEGAGKESKLVWGVFPSSKSANDDSEVLSDFTHRLRTTVSRVRYAERGEPLFIRHTPSAKRSSGAGGSRTDPTGQVETLHLNPFYKDKGRLVGKNVIVIDDCTTYGLSFGVAAAFLRKAGAASMTGVALGKFGSALQYYEIEIKTDPFAPVPKLGYELKEMTGFGGSTSSTTQSALHTLIP